MSIQQNLNTMRHPVSNTPEKSPFNAQESMQEQTTRLRVLLLGSGGRECALAWKIAQSPRLDKLFIAPGNGGTGAYGENVAISPLDFESIENFAHENKIDMIVVGNEDPLVAGIFDYFNGREGAPIVVGPSKAGAALEGSKDFAKQFMVRHSIQHVTAASQPTILKKVTRSLKSSKPPTYSKPTDWLPARVY